MHDKKSKKEKKINQLLRGPFQWPCGSGGTMPSMSTSTAGLVLPEMPLEAAIGQVFTRITPMDAMVIDYFLKLAFKRHETDPLLSSSKKQAA
jgi:hypothetical protein